MTAFKKTDLQEWKEKFWNDLKIKYKDLGFNFQAVRPFNRPYYYMSTEVPYLIFTNRVNKGRGLCKVEFYTEVERAEDLYEALVKYKEEIDSQLSFPLIWNPPCEKHRYFAVEISVKISISMMTKTTNLPFIGYPKRASNYFIPFIPISRN